MAGSRRKSKATAVSYQEVDSDIDMQDDDRQIEASKVQTARKKARKTGKKVKQETGEDKESDAPSLEIFLGAPLDILGQICSHLNPEDLVKLARTFKLFRSLLLSRSSRSIWIAARRAANLPELEGLNEINYALLLSGTTCMECGSDDRSVERDYILRTRHCMLCRKTLLIARGSLKQLGQVHPRAVECLPAAQVAPDSRSWRTYYLNTDVLEISAALNELQEDDDIAQDAWTSRRMATGTRTRKPKEVAEAPKSLVEAFIKEKAAEAKVRTKQGELIPETIARNVDDEYERVKAVEEKAWQTLKLELEVAEWLEDDIQWYQDNVYHYRQWKTARAPPSIKDLVLASSCPSTDPEAWSIVKSEVEALREQQELEDRAQEARDAIELAEERRSALLRPYYDKMRVKQKGDDVFTFPRFEPFKSFASVTPFWKEEDSTVDSDSWEEALEAVKREVEDYRFATRVKAITIILAANNDVPLSSLSTDPADYPEDEFGEAFFAKLTSHFFPAYLTGKPYPKCLHINKPGSTYWGGYVNDGELDLTDFLDRRRVLVLEAICEGTSLDIDTASTVDLAKIGYTLSWPGNPLRSAAQRTFTPATLLDAIVRRYRPNSRRPLPKLVFKHTPAPSISPQILRDILGDSDDDSTAEDYAIKAEEEDVKPVIRLGKTIKKRQRDSDDSEQEDDSGVSDDSEDEPLIVKKRAKKQGVVVKIEDDSDGGLEQEESEEGSDEE